MFSAIKKPRSLGWRAAVLAPLPLKSPVDNPDRTESKGSEPAFLSVTLLAGVIQNHVDADGRFFLIRLLIKHTVQG